MYLEITRWHHVKPSLAFNSDIAPDAHPGLPLISVYAAGVGNHLRAAHWRERTVRDAPGGLPPAASDRPPLPARDRWLPQVSAQPEYPDTVR